MIVPSEARFGFWASDDLTGANSEKGRPLAKKWKWKQWKKTTS